MAINVNNGISNIQGTPGAYTGLFSTAPAANAVSSGTLWFDPFGVGLYQSDGSSWVNYAGGGGPTPGIDTVLAVGQLFSNDRTIDSNNFSLDFTNVKTFNIYTDDFWIYNGNANLRYNGTVLDVPITNANFLLDSSGICYMGSYTGTAENIRIEIRNDQKTVKLINSNTLGLNFDYNSSQLVIGNVNQSGLLIDSSSQVYCLGDPNGASNGTTITVNDSLQTITLYSGQTITLLSGIVGVSVDNTTVQTLIGDINTLQNGSYIGINDNLETVIASTNLLVGTSGSSSGQHLRINVGGTDYVIELKNP